MNCHTKFARLSQQAMTSQHGRLLQDSGFTRQDSTHTASRTLARTITQQLAVLYYRSQTVTGRWSSGRPAIQSIPRKAGLSTSRRQFREMLFMQRFGADEETVRKATALVLSKTSLALSRLESRALLLATPSWELLFPSTPSHFSSLRKGQCISGSIPTAQDLKHVVSLGDSFDWLALSQYESTQPKTQSYTALRRSEEL